MSLKDNMARDLSRVFFNLGEFAELHTYEGAELVCIVDDGDSQAPSSQGANRLRNVTALGLLKCDRVVRCRAAEITPTPVPGQRVRMDDKLWLVGNNVSVDGGLLTLPLNRAY